MVACPVCGQENPDGFRFCGACASLLAAEPLERRKLATLLFCDVSGSTALGERLDAESVRELMTRYFDEMRQAIEWHGGMVEKFIGDAIVGVFGVPVAHEDDALRALRAAVEMRERLVGLNVEFEQRFGNRLALRIGVNTGEVVAGEGSTREMIVTGDAVNVAARLEQSAAPGEILAGATTYRLVRDAADAEAVGPLPVKGKSEPLEAYRVLDVRAPQPSFRGGPLIGRRGELATLEEAFAGTVSDGMCRLVTILGEPGAGKSRLVAEFTSRVGVDATVLAGRCLPYGEGITFWAVAEVVRKAAGIDERQAPEEAEARLRVLLADEQDGELVATRVGQAIGLTAGGAAAAEIAWAVRRLLETLAHARPLVVTIDDLQWAEETLLDLIVGLPRFASGPMLVVCLARAELVENRPEWEASIRLEPLGEREAGQLIDAVLGEEVLATELRDSLTRAAGGNPLFVEELARMLADTAPEPGAEVELPTSLSALLGARLDRLPAEERAVVEGGSVEGELFHFGAVSELLPPERRGRLASDLDALVQKQVLQPSTATLRGEAAFLFRHILVRDAAYGAMAKRLRSDLHERFAGWLERIAGDRLGEYEEICGYHLEQAHRYATELGHADEHTEELAAGAAARLGAAGTRAFARGDMAAAAKLLGRSCSLAPAADVSRLPRLLDLGSAHARLGAFEQADAAFAVAAEDAVALGDEGLALLADVERASWRLWSDPWSREAARPVALHAIRFFGARDEARGLAKAWHLLADVEPRWSSNAEALRCALVHARRAGDRREEADALWWLAVAHYFGPTPVEEAISHCEQILEEGGGERTVEAGARGVLGGLNAMRGRFDEARALFAQGLAILEELGITLRMASRRTISGSIELLAGDPVAAERELRWGLERLQEMGEHHDVPGIAAQIAEALYRQGRYHEAGRFAVLSDSEQHPRMRWRGPKAKLLARRGEFDAAEAVARAAVEAAREGDNLNVEGAALTDLAEVLRLAGRPQEAAEHLRAALSVYELKGNAVEAMGIRTALAEFAGEAAPR